MAATLAAVLMLAGALPAAAEGPAWKGAMDWLSRLWAEATAFLPTIEASCDAGPEIDPLGCPKPRVSAPEPEGDAGYEIDPNG